MTKKSVGTRAETSVNEQIHTCSPIDSEHFCCCTLQTLVLIGCNDEKSVGTRAETSVNEQIHTCSPIDSEHFCCCSLQPVLDWLQGREKVLAPELRHPSTSRFTLALQIRLRSRLAFPDHLAPLRTTQTAHAQRRKPVQTPRTGASTFGTLLPPALQSYLS